MGYSSDVTDKEWEIIDPLLPLSLARLDRTSAILLSLPRSIADDMPFVIYKIDNLTTFAFDASNQSDP